MMNIDWNLVLNFVFRFLLVVFTAFGIPAIKRYLDKKCEEADTDKLIAIIYELVRAAEQLLYDKDEDGKLRKDYVIEQLISLGYIWDNKLNAYVESAVYDLNAEKHRDQASRSDEKLHMNIFYENLKKEQQAWHENFNKEDENDVYSGTDK